MYESDRPTAQDFLRGKINKVKEPSRGEEYTGFGARETDYDNVRFFDDRVGRDLNPKKNKDKVELDHETRRMSAVVPRPGADYSHITGAPKFINMTRAQYDKSRGVPTD